MEESVIICCAGWIIVLELITSVCGYLCKRTQLFTPSREDNLVLRIDCIQKMDVTSLGSSIVLWSCFEIP